MEPNYIYFRTPVNGAYEGHFLRPRSEPLLVNNDYIDDMDEHMEVFAAHSMRPTAQDCANVVNRVIFLGAPNEDEEQDMGRTLILRSASSWKVFAVYFPDGEYEIELADDLNEEWG